MKQDLRVHLPSLRQFLWTQIMRPNNMLMFLFLFVCLLLGWDYFFYGCSCLFVCGSHACVHACLFALFAENVGFSQTRTRIYARMDDSDLCCREGRWMADLEWKRRRGGGGEGELPPNPCPKACSHLFVTVWQGTVLQSRTQKHRSNTS